MCRKILKILRKLTDLCDVMGGRTLALSQHGTWYQTQQSARQMVKQGTPPLIGGWRIWLLGGWCTWLLGLERTADGQTRHAAFDRGLAHMVGRGLAHMVARARAHGRWPSLCLRYLKF